MAAELAVHFARGRDAWRAVHYLHYAGEKCPAAQCLSGSDHPSHHGAGGAGDAPRDPEAGPAGT